MSKRAETASMEAYPDDRFVSDEYADMCRSFYQEGYEQAEKDILSLIESRLSELLGDAQPTPILRYELMDLVKKIKEGE